MSTERDTQICILYGEGETQATIAQRFLLSKVRVGQILHEGGMKKTDRKRAVGRTKFVGIHLSEGMKNALQSEAEGEELSMSAFIAKAIEKELTRRGITVKEPSVSTEIDLPLPLEG